jgi:hypothetical protein
MMDLLCCMFFFYVGPIIANILLMKICLFLSDKFDIETPLGDDYSGLVLCATMPILNIVALIAVIFVTGYVFIKMITRGMVLGASNSIVLLRAARMCKVLTIEGLTDFIRPKGKKR